MADLKRCTNPNCKAYNTPIRDQSKPFCRVCYVFVIKQIEPERDSRPGPVNSPSYSCQDSSVRDTAVPIHQGHLNTFQGRDESAYQQRSRRDTFHVGRTPESQQVPNFTYGMPPSEDHSTGFVFQFNAGNQAFSQPTHTSSHSRQVGGARKRKADHIWHDESQVSTVPTVGPSPPTRDRSFNFDNRSGRRGRGGRGGHDHAGHQPTYDARSSEQGDIQSSMTNETARHGGVSQSKKQRRPVEGEGAFWCYTCHKFFQASSEHPRCMVNPNALKGYDIVVGDLIGTSTDLSQAPKSLLEFSNHLAYIGKFSQNYRRFVINRDSAIAQAIEWIPKDRDMCGTTTRELKTQFAKANYRVWRLDRQIKGLVNQWWKSKLLPALKMQFVALLGDDLGAQCFDKLDHSCTAILKILPMMHNRCVALKLPGLELNSVLVEQFRVNVRENLAIYEDTMTSLYQQYSNSGASSLLLGTNMATMPWYNLQPKVVETESWIGKAIDFDWNKFPFEVYVLGASSTHTRPNLAGSFFMYVEKQSLPDDEHNVPVGTTVEEPMSGQYDFQEMAARLRHEDDQSTTDETASHEATDAEVQHEDHPVATADIPIQSIDEVVVTEAGLAASHPLPPSTQPTSSVAQQPTSGTLLPMEYFTSTPVAVDDDFFAVQLPECDSNSDDSDLY